MWRPATLCFLLIIVLDQHGLIRCDDNRQSLADRLLALWTNGGTSPSLPTALPLQVNNGIGMISSADQPQQQQQQQQLNTDESLKKVLEFLSAKAALSTGNKKVPDAAVAGLEALASGRARTPRPIQLERPGALQRPDTPMAAVLDYFHGLGIDDIECRKRTICELLTEPQAGYGVFGELLGYVFGSDELNPEWTQTMDADTYRAYHEAAVAGRRMLECDQLYGVCRNSYREYIKLANVR